MPAQKDWTHHSRPTYKDRSFWFTQRASFPLSDAPPAELERFWAAQQRSRPRRPQHWESLGPFNVAGRVTSLVLHPSIPDLWFAGSATGGVWRSDDAGRSWTYAWSPYTNNNIGSLAWTHLDGQLTLLAATGEANLSPDSYAGSGIYRSTDHGQSWQPLIHSDGVDPLIGRKLPRRVGCIAIHPRGPIAIAAVSLDAHMPAGLYFLHTAARGRGGRKTDLIPCEFWGRRIYDCHSILFHPGDPKTLLAAIQPGGARNGIWRSHDGGKSWRHLTRGLPSPDFFTRTALAFAPSDPDVVYALVADSMGQALGLFRSSNGGDSWRDILSDPALKEAQMWYNITVAVHPRDPGSVLWGGTNLHRSDDGGRNWRTISTGVSGQRDYVHPDHHVLIWPEDKVIISGNDGGVAVTEDGGHTWHDRSRGMVTAMFYDMDVAPSNPNVFGGGTQDNGTLIAGVPGVRRGDFIRAIPGDGGWMAFDEASHERVFASASPFMIYRHSPGKPWSFVAKNWRFVQPRQVHPIEAQQRGITVLVRQQRKTPKDLPAPKRRRRARMVRSVWAGTSRLWRTDDDGKTWQVISNVFDGSAISGIGVSANPELIFAGTMQGGIYRSRDGGETWSQSLASADIPNRAITCIETHPRLANTLVATVASTGLSSAGIELRTGSIVPYSHVFRSDDAGDTWHDIDGGTLPNVVYYAAAFETKPPYRLFVAGDAGVFVEQSGKWSDLNGNLPHVVVTDLVYHARSGTLTAATLGRGIWRTLPAPGSARKK